jgi:hypothetical protein
LESPFKCLGKALRFGARGEKFARFVASICGCKACDLAFD